MTIADANNIAHYPATAHIPGAISEKTCGECLHLDPCSDKLRGRCVQHFRFRGLAYLFDDKNDPNWWRGLGTIEAATPACKYFALREDPLP
jgi:hypothetical protein